MDPMSIKPLQDALMNKQSVEWMVRGQLIVDWRFTILLRYPSINPLYWGILGIVNHQS